MWLSEFSRKSFSEFHNFFLYCIIFFAPIFQKKKKAMSSMEQRVAEMKPFCSHIASLNNHPELFFYDRLGSEDVLIGTFVERGYNLVIDFVVKGQRYVLLPTSWQLGKKEAEEEDFTLFDLYFRSYYPRLCNKEDKIIFFSSLDNRLVAIETIARDMMLYIGYIVEIFGRGEILARNVQTHARYYVDTYCYDDSLPINVSYDYGISKIACDMIVDLFDLLGKHS